MPALALKLNAEFYETGMMRDGISTYIVDI